MPSYATEGSVGMDVCATSHHTLQPGHRHCFSTGLSLRLEPGWEAQVRSRSGLALKHGIYVLNSPGTIDWDYKGEIGVILHNADTTTPYHVKKGERIAQLVFNRTPQVTLVAETEAERDPVPKKKRKGGFGSTGL